MGQVGLGTQILRSKFEALTIELDIKEVNNDLSSNSSILKEKESDVWNYFDKYKDNNSILHAKYYHYNKGIYNMSSLNSSIRNLIKHFKLYLDKTNPLTKKQAYFIVKFLNNSSQIVSIYKLILFIIKELNLPI